MSSRSLGTLTLDLIAKTGGFEAGMDKAARIADKRTRDIERQATDRAKAIETAFSGMAKSMAAPLAGAAIGLGGIASLDALKNSIDAAISGFSGLKDTAEKTGASIENLSALKAVAKVSDFDFTEVESGLVRLNKALHGTDDESKGAGKALAALGLDLQALRDMDPAQAMLELAKAQESFADGGGKSAAMMAILGKNGAALIPYLNDLAEQGTLIGKVTTEQALAADEYEKNIKKLQIAWGGLSKQMAVAVVGPAKDITDWMVKAQKEGGALDAVLVGIGMSMAKMLGVEINPLQRAENAANEGFQKLAMLKRQLATEQQTLTDGKGLDGMTGGFLAKRKIAELEEQIKATEVALKSAISFKNKLTQKNADENTPKSTALNSQNFGSAPSGPKEKSDKATTDPLTDSAKLYADAMKTLDQAQLKAETSGMQLTATQAELLRVMSDPLFAQMPDEWRAVIAAQAEYTLQTEKVAEDQRRLNDLLGATPTAKLEKSRETMMFLAQAFEDGKISAEQFSEAAQTALGNIPDAAKPATDTFLDMTLIANDAANRMAGAFTDYLFNPMNQSIEEMLASFLKAIAQMIVQEQMLQAVKYATKAISGYARGGVFDDGGVKAYASGGVVTRPTPFKFASGGSFRNGVMGEAGPEAIMPLKRGADGRLGVTVSGGQGGDNTVVNITVNQTGENQSSTGTNNDARILANKIKSVVMDVIATEKRPGGALYN